MNIAIDESMIPHARKIEAGEYDIEGLELPENATVLDIGACCGEFTAWALERWPTCTVIAYEPNPEALKFLYENFKDNPRVTIKPVAVCELDSDTVQMYRGKNNLGEASCFFSAEQRRTDPFVADVVHSLPDADFVKIDAEGSEVEILRMVHMDTVKGVALEWHGDRRGSECAKILNPDANYESEPFAERGILKWARQEGGVFRQWTEEKGISAKPTTDQLYIGIPVHYQPTAAFMISCMGLAQKAPGAGWKILVGDAHPDRARHRIIAEFLASDKEYLLFLDADLKFEADHVLSLLSRGKDIICGFYAKKTPGPPQWVGNALDPKEDKDGLVTMKEAGTGCLLIHRRVFEAIIRAYPELTYQADPDGKETEYAVCQSGVFYDKIAKRRRWLSEDWALCQRARDCGFTVYGDPGVVCLHQGVCMFPTEPGEGRKQSDAESDSK